MGVLLLYTIRVIYSSFRSLVCAMFNLAGDMINCDRKGKSFFAHVHIFSVFILGCKTLYKT